MMGISLGTGMLENFLTETTVFGIEWLITLVVVGLSMLLVSRDYGDWKELFLPMTIMWHVVGLTPSILQYLVAAMIFSTHLFNVRQITQLIRTVNEKQKTLRIKKDFLETNRDKIAKSELMRRMKRDFKQKRQDTKEDIITNSRLMDLINKGK